MLKHSQKCFTYNVTWLFWSVLFNMPLTVSNLASRDFVTFYFLHPLLHALSILITLDFSWLQFNHSPSCPFWLFLQWQSYSFCFSSLLGDFSFMFHNFFTLIIWMTQFGHNFSYWMPHVMLSSGCILLPTPVNYSQRK